MPAARRRCASNNRIVTQRSICNVTVSAESLSFRDRKLYAGFWLWAVPSAHPRVNWAFCSFMAIVLLLILAVRYRFQNSLFFKAFEDVLRQCVCIVRLRAGLGPTS